MLLAITLAFVALFAVGCGGYGGGTKTTPGNGTTTSGNGY